MPDRKMFWRIIRRLLAANRGRLFVILLALSAGATITAALLNLQVDAKRRLTTEFRAFGANVIIAPINTGAADEPRFLFDSLFADLAEGMDSSHIPKAEFLYGIVDAVGSSPESQNSSPTTKVILAGLTYSGNHPEQVVAPAIVSARSRETTNDKVACEIGQRAAHTLKLQTGEMLLLASGARQLRCQATILPPTGGPEDDQVLLALRPAQSLLNQIGRISLIQLSVPGTPQQIESYIASLRRIPDAEVRPIRQFTEGEAKIYNRISGILSATVALVLILTALCVMAAMTNVAMERRNDVGLMKAIGGATRRVLRLFLAEAALLGLTSGILGSAVGVLLSMYLGKAVFGIAARPRLIVYPVAVALTIIVALAGAYPLRRLANIRPAAVFRGEA